MEEGGGGSGEGFGGMGREGEEWELVEMRYAIGHWHCGWVLGFRGN